MCSLLIFGMDLRRGSIYLQWNTPLNLKFRKIIHFYSWSGKKNSKYDKKLKNTLFLRANANSKTKKQRQSTNIFVKYVN